jgi:hypothetical protein
VQRNITETYSREGLELFLSQHSKHAPLCRFITLWRIMSASYELPREHCVLNLGVSSHKDKLNYKVENVEYRSTLPAQNVVSTHMAC